MKKIAYFTNTYPAPSQSFIRREIAALERLGASVDRFAARLWDGPLVDEADVRDRERTRAVLGVGGFGLICALARAAFSRPKAFAEALRLAIQAGRVSDKGVLLHLVYLAEACVLWDWLGQDKGEGGAGHLHAHFGTNSATVAMLCRALGGPPFSFTVHGPEEFDMPRALSLGEKVKRAAFVVAISEYGRSQIYRWARYDDWPKIQVVRCGVDAGFLDAEPTPPPTAPRLVCVGRLAEQKGQLLLLQAAARLHDEGIAFELVLVGDGPMRAEVEALIDRFGLHNSVRITGWASNEDVRREMVAARALVLPSFAEGLPVVIMEALALGRPVVTTYVAGIPELIEPGVCGWLVPPGSVDALTIALREVLAADPATLAAMGRAGADRVAVRHRAEVEAGTLLRLIEAVAPS